MQWGAALPAVCSTAWASSKAMHRPEMSIPVPAGGENSQMKVERDGSVVLAGGNQPCS